MNPAVGAAGTQVSDWAAAGWGATRPHRWPSPAPAARRSPAGRGGEGDRHAAADTIAGRPVAALDDPISSAIDGESKATTSQRSTWSSRRCGSRTPAWPPSRRVWRGSRSRCRRLAGTPGRRSDATRRALAACSVFCAADVGPRVAPRSAPRCAALQAGLVLIEHGQRPLGTDHRPWPERWRRPARSARAAAPAWPRSPPASDRATASGSRPWRGIPAHQHPGPGRPDRHPVGGAPVGGMQLQLALCDLAVAGDRQRLRRRQRQRRRPAT